MKARYIKFEKVKDEDGIMWEPPKWLHQKNLRIVQVLEWRWQPRGLENLLCLCLLEEKKE